MTDISVSIVAYRNYEDIKAAIESIETYTNKEITKKIYIVDNSAQPENEARAQFIAFVSQWEDVQYVDAKENLGFGKGHNYVLSDLDSKYHAIVNPDILLVEDSFQTILSYMEQEDVGMVVPKLIYEDGEMIKAYRREVTIWDMFIRFCCPGMFGKRKAYHTMDDCDFSKAMDVPFAQGSFLVARTHLLQELGGFDDRFFMYMEDADLCKRINQVSVVRYLPDTSVIHKWERGSHKSSKLMKIHIQSMIRYFKKWGCKFV